MQEDEGILLQDLSNTSTPAHSTPQPKTSNFSFFRKKAKQSRTVRLGTSHSKFALTKENLNEISSVIKSSTYLHFYH
jgi:hypothetical protein